MKLDRFDSMDPHLLVGLVNTELRNNADDLPDLCKTHNIEEKALKDRLAQADYFFQEDSGQFR